MTIITPPPPSFTGKGSGESVFTINLLRGAHGGASLELRHYTTILVGRPSTPWSTFSPQ